MRNDSKSVTSLQKVQKTAFMTQYGIVKLISVPNFIALH